MFLEVFKFMQDAIYNCNNWRKFKGKISEWCSLILYLVTFFECYFASKGDLYWINSYSSLTPKQTNPNNYYIKIQKSTLYLLHVDTLPPISEPTDNFSKTFFFWTKDTKILSFLVEYYTIKTDIIWHLYF